MQLKSPIISLCVLLPLFIIVFACSQKSGLSFEGAYTTRVSSVLWSGKVMVKKSVSLLPLLLMFVILQPLCLLRRTKIPLFFEGLPMIVYFEKSVRWRFFRVSSLN